MILKETTTGKAMQLPILFIKGRTALMNLHYRRILEHLQHLTWGLYKPDGSLVSEIDVKKLCETEKEYVRGGIETDVVAVQFPKHIARYCDLTSFVPNASYFSNIVGVRVVLSVPGENGWVQKFGNVKSIGIQNYRDENHISRKGASILTNIGSTPGDCGGVYIVDENATSRRLVAFHFAGIDGGACATPLVYEDLMEILHEEDYQEPQVQGGSVPEVFQQANVQYCGVIDPAPSQPMKSKFVQTRIFGQVFESEMLPSALDPSLDKDKPLGKGISKQFEPQAKMEPLLLEEAVFSYRQRLSETEVDPRRLRVLSFEEAVQGVEGEEYLRGINRTTSAGFPYCLTSKSGKKDWFGENEWTMDSEKAIQFKGEVLAKVSEMEKGISLPFIFMDMLKDETRPIEKVRAGKTRVFAAAPMDFVVIFRMYFLAFTAWMMEGRIKNESAVGIVAQSMEWHELAKHLGSQSFMNVMAGDFTNYDGTLNIHILAKILTIIEDYYKQCPGWKKEDENVRKALWESITNSFHIVKGHVYKLDHSQPSGNPMTAVLNSMYNSIVMRYVYYARGYGDFNNNVSMIAYGDDNVVAVNEACTFNQIEASEEFEKIGMKYTNESKEEIVTSGMKELRDCGFLQRDFAYNPELKIWVGALKLRSIMECFNWIHETTDELGVIRQNFEMANVELAYHPQEVFAQWMGKLNGVIAHEYGSVLAIRDRDWLLLKHRMGKIPYEIPHLQWV